MPRIRQVFALLVASLALVPASADAQSGPVAAYGFEDAAGTVVGDSSIYGSTGTIEGGATRAAGRFGSAVTFDGVNDRVRVGDAGSINLASGMTLEAWVNPSATNGWRTVLMKERVMDLSYGLYGSGEARPAIFTATDGETGSAKAVDALPLNTWTHLAATYDGTTLRMYVDGALIDATNLSSGPLIPGNGPLSIGGNTIYGEWFKGLIDEVRVYDRALSASQIQADMAAPVGAPASSAPGRPASEVGSWTPPQNWPLVAVHASMLSDGKVVSWDAFSAAPQSEHVWDPETGAFVPRPSGINLFCAGHALLPDGRLFVAGGHELAYAGLRDTRLFNPLTSSWTAGPDMARGRWYPTTTTLPDGRILIVSGDGIRTGPNDPYFVRPSDTIPEIYDPKTNTITAMPSAGRLMPLYPYMFVAPDGRVVDAGPDTTTRLLNTQTGQWSTLASRSPVTGSSAVMYRPGKILKTGSWTDTDFGDPPIVNGSTVLDLDQGVPAWRNVAPMKWARTYHTLTVLPDGDVLSLGGQSRFNANALQDSPVLQPEVWDPDTDTWTALASSKRPRGYHNTSLLLPDGRILLAGSGRLDGSLMVDETTAEIYSPPYLHKGPRPTITSAPATMEYGGTIALTTPDAANIAKVSLVRIGSVTHQFNMDQRWQELSFRQSGGGLEIDAPTSPNVAPPGVYYVFVLGANGVPSKAAILSISSDTAPPQDTTAPSVPQGLTATGAVGRATLSWSASTDNVGVARYTVHRSTTSGFTPGATTRIGETSSATMFTDSGLAPGTYYYRVVAEDLAGNASAPSAQATGTALADTTAPTVALTAPAAGASVQGTVSVTSTATDDVGVTSVQFRLDGANLGAADAVAPYSVSWDTTGASPGPHTLTAIAADAAGNTRTSAAVTVTVDNSAPQGPVPVAAYSFEEGAGATVSDATGKGHTGTLREATWTTAGRNGKALSFDGVNDWVTIADAADLRFTSGLTIEAWVSPTSNSSWRTAVMKERSGDLTWGLYSAGANTPSVYVGSATTKTGSAAPINAWTHLAATYDGTTVRLFVNGTQTASVARSNALGAQTGALRLGGNGVWGEFFAGKLDDVRIYASALTPTQIQIDMNTPVGPPAPADTTAPTAPSAVSAVGAMGRVDLSWTASTDNVGVARYKVHRASTGGFTPSAANLVATVVTGTSYTDTGLAVGSYHYRVIAEDQAGNASPPSSEASGMATGDASAPSTPTGVTATGALGRVSLTWTASTDNVGVARYVVYRSTMPGFTPGTANRVATVNTGTTYADTGLAAGTYYYRVTAEDQAGNGSPPSSEATGTALGDTTAPVASLTAPAPGATIRGTATLTATATDDVGVVGVQFLLDGSALGAEDTAAPYSASWDSTTATPGAHTLSVVARDAAGNVTTTVAVAVTVDNSAPSGPAPVAAYSFEDGTGATVTDTTGRGHTGTIREATWTTSGRTGKGLAFDGVNDWVTIDDVADLRLTTAMTIEAWVNPSSVSNWRTVIMKERAGELAYALYSSGQNRPSAYLLGGSATSPSAITVNTWTHLAATYDATTIRLYVNGVQRATAARTNALAASAGALRLGGNSIWGEWFAGRLDDVRIYDKALTAAQVTADMNTPVGG